MDPNNPSPVPPIPSAPSAAGPKQPQQRYIRTFAGDLETLKSGGTPDLSPIGESTLEQVPDMPRLPKPTPLKTYENDFSDKVKDTKASFATVLAAEQDSLPPPQVVSGYSSDQSSVKNALFIGAGVLLLILGGVGAYFGYSRYSASTNPDPVVIAPTVSAPIFVDERETVSGGGAVLLRAVQDSVRRPLASGTVRLISFDPSSSLSSVFVALYPSAPAILARNIRPDTSMAGVVNARGTASTFFILSVSSYGETFSGMLSWETVMPRDFASLYPPPAAPVQATTTASSTPPSVPTAQPVFVDAVVGNYDVRAYRDESGRTIFLYGYWNQNTLLIARDEASFAEIAARLATSRSRQ